MSKLTDVLKSVIEPLKLLLDRVDKKADEVKKKIDGMPSPVAYDTENKTVIFNSAVSLTNYGGNYYWTEVDNLKIEYGSWYEIYIADMKCVRMASGSESEPIIYIMDDKSPLLRIVTVSDNTCKLIGAPVGFRLNISKIIGTDFQQVPAHLMELPLATNGSDGVVQVTDVKEYADRGGDPTNGALGVWIYRNDRKLYVDSPLPYASSSKQGQILRVNSKGEWVSEKATLLSDMDPVKTRKGKIPIVKDGNVWDVSDLDYCDKNYVITHIIKNGWGTNNYYGANFTFDELWNYMDSFVKSSDQQPNIFFVVEDIFGSTSRDTKSILNFYYIELLYEGENYSTRSIVFWCDSEGKMKIKMHEDDTLEVLKTDSANIILPSTPTTSDSGKIPMVQSDGSWGLVSIPVAEEASF